MSEISEQVPEPKQEPKEEKVPEKDPLWQRIFFSPVIRHKSSAQKIAYIGITTALCIVTNFFEIKLIDTQFSFTILMSMLTGILIGPLYGAFSAFLGDAIGFIAHPNNIYMPWIGLSVAMMAVIAGLLMRLPLHFKGSMYVKLAIACLLVVVVCSVGINTTGMYLYYTNVGFTSRSLGLIQEHFGGNTMFFTYALVRLIFMGQLLNNVVNFALLFAILPTLRAIKPLHIDL